MNARAVIIGSGICGSSLAYHLSKRGWKDVVVLERGPLRSGTTSHAPGLVGQLRSSPTLTRMLMDSVALYDTLEVDGQRGYFPVGSLRLAGSPERLTELKRQLGLARAVGLEAELLGVDEARGMVPWLNWQGILGALYLPRDGSAKAGILTEALARGAHGATFLERRPVRAIERDPRGRVCAVVTPQGRIETEIVVIASGIWSPRLGRLAGIDVPLRPMQHQYVRTAKASFPQGPNVRDPDRLVYFRQDGDQLVLGGYERNPAFFDVDAIPENDNPTVHPFDPPRFEPLLEACRELVPGLPEVTERVNGLESFTPDGEFIVGPSPEVGGLWLACGFCAHGVSGSGGVGKHLADWIVDGQPALDLWHMDPSRLMPHTASPRYVRERIREVYGTYYDVAIPGTEKTSARGLRLSPVYPRLQALGAVFGEKAGWERPLYFGQSAECPAPKGWAAHGWSPAIAYEHHATRERVALFDQSSFAKLEVSGPGALAFMQWMAANQMDRKLGSVTYTQLCNERGGIESDVTVTRLAEDRFRIVTGTAFGGHDGAWLRRHAPAGVTITDLTSSLGCLGLWGPQSRELLASVSEDDFTKFPYMTARQVFLKEVPVLAVRVTYVGELGWELYFPVEYGCRLWDVLWEAGPPTPAGYRAIDSLRLEKGYRYWSADIGPHTNPFEAGLGFAVKLDKGEFLGREALQRLQAEGVQRRLACLVLHDPQAVVVGNEPVFAEGRAVGQVTSGGFGYTVGKSIAYSYLPLGLTAVEVELYGERVPAAVTEEPLFDPGNLKIRA